MNKFPAFKSVQAAAASGCFKCERPVDEKSIKDSGYPAKRGQFAMHCAKCGVFTFFDLRDQQSEDDSAHEAARHEEEIDDTCRFCMGTGDGGIPRGPGYSFPCGACRGTGTVRALEAA